MEHLEDVKGAHARVFFLFRSGYALDLQTHKEVFMSMLTPSLEYACEVWEANKCQAKVLESITVTHVSACTCMS